MKEPKVPLLDLVMCLSDAMDFISPDVVDHHKQVAYIAFSIAAEMGLPAEQQKDIIIAGALHDIGAFSLKERLDTLDFEIKDPYKHAESGFSLLRIFEPMVNVAPVVRFHHLPWRHGRGIEFKGMQVPIASHILHLSDRIAVLVRKDKEVLGQSAKISDIIRKNTGKMFNPELVDIFMDLAGREYFWLDLVSTSIPLSLSNRMRSSRIILDTDDILGFSKLFSRIIDFKSPFTATHSSGVVESAGSLADFLGFSEKDRLLMRIAGYLHDLGKLAVPVEILNKPSKLARNEFNIIRHHTFYTYRILEAVPGLKTINSWASFHHERLDGSGYPFHLTKKDLSLGSQIMAVADVFTAITEDRPYRAGMTKRNALSVLQNMAETSALNSDIVSVLRSNYEEMNIKRMKAQEKATKEYRGMLGK